MKKISHYTYILLGISLLFLAVSCDCFTCKVGGDKKQTQVTTTPQPILQEVEQDEFKYFVEKFADLKVIRYQVPGFAELPLENKQLIYYLQQAGFAGYDILYHQNYAENIRLRKTFEEIIKKYEGDRTSSSFQSFLTYVKRFWVCKGIHHFYTDEKLEPGFSQEDFLSFIANTPEGIWPLIPEETTEKFAAKLTSILFDPRVVPVRTNRNTKQDVVKTSSVSFYKDVTQKEVEKYYSKRTNPKDKHPVQTGLNTSLMKEKGKVVEKAWKVGGIYSESLEKIVYWLEKAITVASTKDQAKALEKLVTYFKTGDLKVFDQYSLDWVNDTKSSIDVVIGFIESYVDPLGMRGMYESYVTLVDKEATGRATTISKNAQWFEDHSPIAQEYKKKEVKGIDAKVVSFVTGSGEMRSAPPTIGVNLPNSSWIRKEHGSKSVSFGNIMHALFEDGKEGGGFEEFVFSEEVKARTKQYGMLANDLQTDLHEIIGHASGQQKVGVDDPRQAIKTYYSALEESRAEVIALYYGADPKLIELGLVPNEDVGKAGFDHFIINGLMKQLARIDLGQKITDSHMRSRYLITRWVLQHGAKDNVIEKKVRDGKTYYVINDYAKLRNLFGDLLIEIQRIKSEGDYEAGKNLVETYAVTPDHQIHQEVKQRWAKLNIPSFATLLVPLFQPVMNGTEITDVTISYPKDFSEHMLQLGEEYSYLLVADY
ncbi:MAG: dihydrofolate reductase [bacterium]